MNFSLSAIQEIFQRAGAIKLFAKPLVNNDNSKQQIYLGGSFEVLKAIPFGGISTDNQGKRQNFKAPVKLSWLTKSLDFEQAQHTKLILYPDYPEVRLSGFLRGCPSAPSEHMRPIERYLRLPNNSWDGRVLFLGVTRDSSVLAYLAINGSSASQEFDERAREGTLEKLGVLYSIPHQSEGNQREILLSTLKEIHCRGWVGSMRLDAQGQPKPYRATNGGGYTLEALLGVKPNGRAEPDFHGWEIKAYSGDRITLMTPEPKAGYYGDEGLAAFLHRYGYHRPDKVIYFTGTHRVGILHAKTTLILRLDGYNPASGKIESVTGGISLIDNAGSNAASWPFSELITHWAKKHARAAYVPYELEKNTPSGLPHYRFSNSVGLGYDSSFLKYLSAMYSGLIVYDPASRMETSNEGRTKVKARNQFRISAKHLSLLYANFEQVPLIG